MRVGDKVRINFPEGASWTKRIGQNTYTAADIEGKTGVITQSMGNTGALEHKVNLVGIGEVKFWERDLSPVEATAEAHGSAEGVESSQPEESEDGDGASD